MFGKQELVVYMAEPVLETWNACHPGQKHPVDSATDGTTYFGIAILGHLGNNTLGH